MVFGVLGIAFGSVLALDIRGYMSRKVARQRAKTQEMWRDLGQMGELQFGWQQPAVWRFFGAVTVVAGAMLVLAGSQIV